MPHAPGLTEEILRHKDVVRFHTPSYAGKDLHLAACDVTELPYTDDLLRPSSHILELEKKLASAYRAEACFISTQGATFNIFQAIFARKNAGAFLLIGALHASVYNAMRLFDLTAYHVDAWSPDLPVPSDVRTAILTSPDYFGNVLPLSFITRSLREKGIVSIIDSAHGGHFVFSEELPVSAAEYGDMVIVSLHKTLPVLTGGSLLLTKNEYAFRCALYRKTAHSTSPNFAVICSIERAVRDFSENGAGYYRDVLSSIRSCSLRVREPFFFRENDDPTRLVLVTPYDGAAVYDALLEKGFAAELSYGNTVVFIVNPYNYEALDALVDAINALPDLPAYVPAGFLSARHDRPVRLSFGGEPEAEEPARAVGRAVYAEVGFYPPGVPILYAGDVLTAEQAAILSDPKMQKCVFGLESGKILVIK